MNIKHLGVLGLSLLMLGLTQNAAAQEFSRAGKIIRVFTDSQQYGACMIQLDISISNGCPANGFVSLDCVDLYYATGEGKRKYATALTGYALNSNVLVKLDNTKKHDGYCVASRLDLR